MLNIESWLYNVFMRTVLAMGMSPKNAKWVVTGAVIDTGPTLYLQLDSFYYRPSEFPI